MKILDQNGVAKLIALIQSSLTPLESFQDDLSSIKGIVQSDGNGGFSATEVADAYFVPMTVSSAGDGSYTTTTTAVFGDVKAAAVSGKSVWAKVSYLGDYVYIPLTVYASSTIIFSGSYSTYTIFTVFWVNENQPRFVRSDVLTDGSLADSTPLAAGEASSGTGAQAARADHVHPKELPDGLELGSNYIILASSTADSTKKFKITVDDSGTLTATEVTTTTT